MSTTHSNLITRIRKKVAPDTILFRYAQGLYHTAQGSPVLLGQKGVLDTVGFHMTLITPEMVGKRLPVFTAIDAKVGKDSPRKAQKWFADMVTQKGGYAGFCYHEDEAENIFTKPFTFL
jgi:hypothetical protein